MFCTNCGKESSNNQKFCVSCGTGLSSEESPISQLKHSKQPKKKYFEITSVIRVIIVVIIIGGISYFSQDSDVIDTNNSAISSFDSGDSEAAIIQLQEATNSATLDTNKLNTLKNLAYVYSSDGYISKALSTFKEALQYTTVDSFEYYLVSGEIALLESKPTAAKISYEKAYNLQPDDFQINNALNLFYLDLEDVHHEHVNYPKALEHAKTASRVGGAKVENITKQNLAVAQFFNDNYDQTITLLSGYDFDKEPYLAYWIGLAYASIEDENNGVYYLQKAVDGGVEVPQEVYDYLSY